VMMMSLRAGAGIDGLQKVCSAVVFGELDWSPQVHRQNVWRIDRDGQENPVAAFYCVSDGGTDPLMEETLELKRQQSGALVSKDDDAELFNVTPTDEGRIRRLAEQIVSQ
jgi:SNF2 family DNA or RNA helicase